MEVFVNTSLKHQKTVVDLQKLSHSSKDLKSWLCVLVLAWFVMYQIVTCC